MKGEYQDHHFVSYKDLLATLNTQSISPEHIVCVFQDTDGIWGVIYFWPEGKEWI